MLFKLIYIPKKGWYARKKCFKGDLNPYMKSKENYYIYTNIFYLFYYLHCSNHKLISNSYYIYL